MLDKEVNTQNTSREGGRQDGAKSVFLEMLMDALGQEPAGWH